MASNGSTTDRVNDPSIRCNSALRLPTDHWPFRLYTSTSEALKGSMKYYESPLLSRSLPLRRGIFRLTRGLLLRERIYFFTLILLGLLVAVFALKYERHLADKPILGNLISSFIAFCVGLPVAVLVIADLSERIVNRRRAVAALLPDLQDLRVRLYEFNERIGRLGPSSTKGARSFEAVIAYHSKSMRLFSVYKKGYERRSKANRRRRPNHYTEQYSMAILLILAEILHDLAASRKKLPLVVKNDGLLEFAQVLSALAETLERSAEEICQLFQQGWLVHDKVVLIVGQQEIRRLTGTPGLEARSLFGVLEPLIAHVQNGRPAFSPGSSDGLGAVVPALMHAAGLIRQMATVAGMETLPDEASKALKGAGDQVIDLVKEFECVALSLRLAELVADRGAVYLIPH